MKFWNKMRAEKAGKCSELPFPVSPFKFSFNFKVFPQCGRKAPDLYKNKQSQERKILRLFCFVKAYVMTLSA